MATFISKLFRIGLVLAALGQLKSATLFFMREAAKEQQRGLTSLSALNHALMDRPGANDARRAHHAR